MSIVSIGIVFASNQVIKKISGWTSQVKEKV